MDTIYSLTDSHREWWKNNYKLLEVYDVYNLPSEFHLRGMKQFSLRTEVYISEPKICIPIQARYWEVDRWLYKGKLVDYDFLRKLPNFKGYGNFCQVYLVELWGGCGDDGHIENVLEGYGLATIKSLNAIIDQAKWSL